MKSIVGVIQNKSCISSNKVEIGKQAFRVLQMYYVVEVNYKKVHLRACAALERNFLNFLAITFFSW